MPPFRYSRLDKLQPGDVVVVRTKSKLAGALIRLGAALAGRPDSDDHVAVVHHRDAAGVLWGLEARPGAGVSWVDLAEYDNRWLRHNAAQPKTDAQRRIVCELAVELLHTPYDWLAILHDAVAVFGFELPDDARDLDTKRPAHLVCSAYASWLYQRAELACPATLARWTTPGDWAAFIDKKGWPPE